MIQTLEELAVKLEEQGKNAVPFQVKTELLEESAAGSRAARTAKAYKKEQKAMKELRAWMEGFLSCLHMEGVITQEEYLALCQIMLDMQFH